MKIVKQSISLEYLKKMAKSRFGELVKAVVDIDKRIMAVDGELHADEEALLLENGSKQENLWGVNIYPDLSDKNWIEFDSVINIRPSANNFSREVENPELKNEIIEIVNQLIKK